MALTVRYTEAPMMHISYDCLGMSCGQNTIYHDGDSFICKDCGTSWHDDCDEGELYEKWSGETPDLVAKHPDD